MTNHFYLTAEKEMQDIYFNKLGLFGVRYFEYLRVYDDGHSVIIASNKDLIRYVFDNELPMGAPIQQEYIQDKFHYFILPIGQYEQPVHHVIAYFNLSYFINLVERHPGYIDLYCFGAHAANPEIMNFYLNKMDVLHKFIDYFKNEASSLINQALQNKILLSDKMLPPYQGLLESRSSAKSNYDLTTRQLDCLFSLMKGMSIKQIAKHLSLSPRTIEHYLESIKIKMDCASRVELFEKAWQLEVIRNRLN
jgi:DNA-binding CsgD family transcriptional regulator